jgi:phytoene/squalene synthetase
LAGLLLPARAKRPFFALAALNVETASMKSLRQDSLRNGNAAAAVKLQWWHERVADIYEDRLDPVLLHQPLVQELQNAIRGDPERPLTRRFLEQLLAARQADLATATHESLNDLEAYVSQTQGPLLKLQLEALGVQSDGADHVATHLGMGIGLANFLRSVPPLAAQGHVALPGELMEKHRISSSVLLKPEERDPHDDENLRAAAFDLAVVGNEHLRHARDTFLNPESKVPAEARGAFLRGVDARLYFERMEVCNFDMDEARLKQGGLGSLPVQLAKTKFFSSDPF